MSFHSVPASKSSELSVVKFELTNPKARGAADALDPDLHWDGQEPTSFQKDKVTWFDRHASLITSQAQAETEELEIAIKEIALPIDRHGIIVSTIKNVEQVHDLAKFEFDKLATDLASAAKDKADFEDREGRPSDAEIVYSLQPNNTYIIFSGISLMAVEAILLAIFIGPFAPGGRVQAFFYCISGCIVLGFLSILVGYFGLRAWSVANPVIRIAARLTVVFGTILIKAVIAFIAAYRTHLETGKPISQSLTHIPPDALLLILLSFTIVLLTIWKARGGNTLGIIMPYSTYWGESRVDRPYRTALMRLEEAREHHRRQIIEDIYGEESNRLDQIVSDAEQKLQQLCIDANKLKQRSLHHEQLLRNLRTDINSDLYLYETAVRQGKNEAIVTPIVLSTPEIIDVQKIIDHAIHNAAERLVSLRNTIVGLAQPLTEARAEAVAQLDLMFRDFQARAYAAQGLQLEEAKNA